MHLPVPGGARLRWLLFLLAHIIAAAALVLLQNSIPVVAALLFASVVVVSAVLLFRYYEITVEDVVRGTFQVVRALVYFYFYPGVTNEAQPVSVSDRPSPFLSVIVLLAMGCGLILALLFLPFAPVVSISIIVVLVGLGVLMYRLQIDALILLRLAFKAARSAVAFDTVEIEAIPRRRLATEIGLIVAVVLFFTHQFYSTPADLQFTGGEAEWITASAYTAYDGLQHEGRIPLWQPYLESGEPLVENPILFILNPFSGVPDLLLGAQTGIKISIVLAALVASVGGWFLARILGLGTFGRLMLAMLLLGKGNMWAMLNTGYLQLGASQAYIPWVIGGTLAILRFPRQRWPVVLTAISITLLYFMGNLWYVLPTIVCAALLALAYLFRGGKQGIDWFAARRFLLMFVLVAGLSAVTLIPLLVNFNRIGKHLPQVEAGWVIPILSNAVPLYMTSDPYFQLTIYNPASRLYEATVLDRYKLIYFSFTIPFWYLALILVFIPLYRLSSGQTRRFWLMAIALLILATSWGAGGQPIFLWLYAHVPLMSQWRFVGRAFAIGSFWLAVLIAMRVDRLWSHIRTTDWGQLGLRPRLARVFPLILSAVLVVASAVASWEVNVNWNTPTVNPINPLTDRCITWLRQTYPDQPLVVWQTLYQNMTTFIVHHVRDWDVQADFEMSPLPPTIGASNLDLTTSMAEFALPANVSERQYFKDHHYVSVDNSPRLSDGSPCLVRLPDVIPYSYTIPVAVIENYKPLTDKLSRRDFPDGSITPVETFVRNEDNIAVLLNNSPNDTTILTLQERAYPGWRVEINGQPAKIESVGGQIGVVLPRSDAPLRVYFEYRPPLLMLGGVITLLTSAFCTAYLLAPFRRKRI